MHIGIGTGLVVLAAAGLCATGCSTTEPNGPGDGGVATCSSAPLQLTDGGFGSMVTGVTANAVAWQGFGSLTDTSTDSEIYLWDGTTTRQLTDDAVSEYSPAVGGGRVAWTRGLVSPEVFFWDGTTATQLTDGASRVGYLAVDASSVVWATTQSWTSVYLYDGTRTRSLNPAGLRAATAPSLDAGRVAFVAAPQSVSLGGSQVYLWAKGKATQISTSNLEKFSPVLRGKLVVWRETDAGATQSRVVLWSGGAPEVVSDPTLMCGGGTTDGTRVAWACRTGGAGVDIFVRRGKGDVIRFAQPAGTYTQGDLVTGGAVAWARFSPAPKAGPVSARIVVYDGTQLRTVATAALDPRRSALTVGLRLRGGRLAWVDYDGLNSQVHTERVTPCP